MGNEVWALPKTSKADCSSAEQVNARIKCSVKTGRCRVRNLRSRGLRCIMRIFFETRVAGKLSRLRMNKVVKVRPRMSHIFSFARAGKAKGVKVAICQCGMR